MKTLLSIVLPFLATFVFLMLGACFVQWKIILSPEDLSPFVRYFIFSSSSLVAFILWANR